MESVPFPLFCGILGVSSDHPACTELFCEPVYLSLLCWVCDCVCVHTCVCMGVCSWKLYFFILPPLCFLRQGLSLYLSLSLFLSLNLALTDSARLAHELCLHLTVLGSWMCTLMPSFYMVWWIDTDGPIGSDV